MDLRRFENEIYDFLTNEINLTVEVKEDVDDRTVLSASITVNALGDEDILLMVTVLDNLEAFVTFTFDSLYKDEEALNLVNDVNNAQAVFRAFINDDGYVKLTHYVYNAGSPRDFREVVSFCLEKFVEDDILELLEPICELTD